MAQSELWLSGSYWQEPPRPCRSFPWPASRLEVLAARVGVSDTQLREHLQHEVQARLRRRGDAWKNLDSTLEARQRRNGRHLATN